MQLAAVVITMHGSYSIFLVTGFITACWKLFYNLCLPAWKELVVTHSYAINLMY